MFVHKSQLAYQLVPEDYFSPEQHRREVNRLMLPAWHLVGSRDDLPRDGDFITLEMFERPILIHNFGGDLKAFLNVCAHRHCRLTDLPSGRQAAPRCQYHGWEYGADGHTRRIPDAGCFRPFDREQAQLQSLRLEKCGDLLFVALTDDGPSLADFLGDCYPIIERLTTGPWRCIWRWQHDYPCNWKLPIENTVETYHLPCIHSKTFSGIYPSEEAQIHALEDRGSKLCYDLREDRGLARMQRWVVRRLGGTSTDVYTHYLIHPNFVLTTSDLYLHAHVYLPVTPTSSRAIVRMYGFGGSTRSLWRKALARLIAYNGRRVNRQIQLEDASIFAAQQRGTEVSSHAGCLGTREERIWAFQRYIRDHAGSVAAPDVGPVLSRTGSPR